MSAIKEWNLIDRIIWKIEHFMSQIHIELPELSDEADIESIILAETEHLRTENDRLKAKQIPKAILLEEKQYFCPDCRKALTGNIRELKYCQECGRRIFLQHISKNNNIV